jgi:hypothetical protein
MNTQHRIKTILPLAAVAMFASASVSNAASVVYVLSADGGVIAGNLTFDSAIAPTSTDGGTGNHTFTHATTAIPAFSFTRSGTTGVFDNVNDTVTGLSLITDVSLTPLFLFIDIDDSVSGSWFGTLIFDGGTHTFDTFGAAGQGTDQVTNAALTAQAIPEPGSLALLGLSGLALFLRRRR